MKRFPIAGLVVVTMLGGPVVAQAQWFVGGSVGSPDSDIDVAVYNPPLSTADDSSPVSWKLFAGYAFGENLHLEGGFTDFGNEYQLFNALGYGEVLKFKPAAATVTLVGRVRTHDRVHLLVRLGAAYWTARVDYTEGTFHSSRRDGDVDPVMGVGFDFELAKRVGLRFEWEEIQNVGDDASATRPPGAGSTIELGGHNMTTIAVGVRLRLGRADD